MGQSSKPVVTDAPWTALTYQIIGLAMELHNELGPGHREIAYHNGMLIKLQSAKRAFESEPYIPVTMADGSIVRGQSPDFIVERLVIVELKAHLYTMTKDEQAQIIGYFAAFPESSVALYLNFGRPRLEIHRLFPPRTIPPYRREKWGRPDGTQARKG
ncbi:MAG: GxxExxY protein [Anaerolineae bacterium]